MEDGGARALMRSAGPEDDDESAVLSEGQTDSPPKHLLGSGIGAIEERRGVASLAAIAAGAAALVLLVSVTKGADTASAQLPSETGLDLVSCHPLCLRNRWGTLTSEGPGTVCGDSLALGEAAPGFNPVVHTKEDCTTFCAADPDCKAVQWVGAPDPTLTQCLLIKSEVCSVSPAPTTPSESMPTPEMECFKKCKEVHVPPTVDLPDCVEETKMTCQLDCEGPASASTEVPLTVGADPSETECFDACKAHDDCQGYVYTPNVAKKCVGVRQPTTGPLADKFPLLRPMLGVQTGACKLPYPDPAQYPTSSCPAKSPYPPWGQTTSFISCRPPPWAKCALYGDPHFTTFDRPFPGEQCPSKAKDRGSGGFHNFNTGVYTLVARPAADASDLHVTGRFGVEGTTATKSYAKGLAVTGARVGGHRLVVEMVEDGSGTVKATWDGAPILALDTNDHTPNFETSSDGHMQGKLSWVDVNLKDLALGNVNIIGVKPTFSFKLFDVSGHEVMRAFLQRAGKQYLTMVITMPKDYIMDQEGLCGNFNCDMADDAKNDAEQAHFEVQFADSLFTGDPPAVNAVGPVVPDDDPQMLAATGQCEDAGVLDALGEACGADILYNSAESQEIIDAYKAFGPLYANV